MHWQPGVDSATFIPADEKNPKSYRNSIKNKFRSTAAEIANIELDKEAESEPLMSESMSKELSDLHLTVPNLRLPSASDNKQNALEKFISTTETRIENDNYIQEIHELQKIPILFES